MEHTQDLGIRGKTEKTVTQYLLADAGKDDEEGDEQGAEADVNQNVANVLDCGRAIHRGVQHRAAIVAEGVKPAGANVDHVCRGHG